MKLATKLLAASALTLALGSAFAADPVQITVSGKINTPACEIATPASLNVSFGEKFHADLTDTLSRNQLAPQQAEIKVNCTADTIVALSFSDNQTIKPTESYPFAFKRSYGTASSFGYFSLGATDTGVPTGAVSIRVDKILVNEQEAPFTRIGQTADILASSAFTGPGGGNNISVGPGQYAIAYTALGGTAARGSRFVFPLDIAATITTKAALPANKDIPLNGSIAITAHYL